MYGNYYSCVRWFFLFCGGYCLFDWKLLLIFVVVDCFFLLVLWRYVLYVYRVEGRFCIWGVWVFIYVLVLFCIFEFILDICIIDIDNISLCSFIGEFIWGFI